MKILKLITDAWLVILLSIIFGGGLAAVHVSLKDRIEENKLEETLASIPALVPGADKGEPAEINGLGVFKALNQTKQLGWVIPAKGQGFADSIELLIGIDYQKEKITGLYILDQKETPGLGNKICESSWLQQFAGKSTVAELKVVKGGDDLNEESILAVSGATISSESVRNITGAALKKICSPSKSKGGKQ